MPPSLTSRRIYSTLSAVVSALRVLVRVIGWANRLVVKVLSSKKKPLERLGSSKLCRPASARPTTGSGPPEKLMPWASR